jgi:hypothetical protein
VSHGAAIHNLEENRFAHTQPKDFASGLMFILVGLGFVARGYSMGQPPRWARLLSVPARPGARHAGRAGVDGVAVVKGEEDQLPAGT